ETEADRVETFSIMSEIARRHANVSFSPNVFTPYPGIPIWPQLKEMGLREPQSLEEWADVALGNNLLPWLQGYVFGWREHGPQERRWSDQALPPGVRGVLLVAVQRVVVTVTVDEVPDPVGGHLVVEPEILGTPIRRDLRVNGK